MGALGVMHFKYILPEQFRVIVCGKLPNKTSACALSLNQWSIIKIKNMHTCIKKHISKLKNHNT